MRALAFIRSLILAIWFPVHTIFCAIAILLGNLIISSHRLNDFVISNLWAAPVLWLANIDVDVRGVENWPMSSGSLVVFNHTSWLDIVILVRKLPRVPRFGAKIELFKIPIFGSAMKRAGMLPIERHQRSRVLEVYRAAESRAQKGECFALAPEGTRQKELVLGKFKQGPFLFAIGAQIPVVPVVLSGVREIMPKGTLLISSRFWRGRAVLQILAPQSPIGIAAEAVGGFQQSVREAMLPAYAQLNQELGLSL